MRKRAIEELKNYRDQVFVVVFTAEWCNNCATNFPILALFTNECGLRVRVFSGLKRDVLNPKVTWRVPPSPPDLDKFGVEKIPHMSVRDMNGKELGRIIENPDLGMSVEEEIVHLASLYR